MCSFSIIVPVYNVDRYLAKCLSSIMSQTYQDFELLLIDDGSTDNSPEICDEYAKQYENIKVFHKKNEGVSAARNIGISESKGEWIYFADADDELCVDALSSFKKIIDSHDTDIAFGGYRKFNDQGQTWEYKGEEFCSILSKPEIVKQVLKGTYYPIDYIWLAVYKRSIIMENHIRFNESIHLHEDNLFLIDYICHTTLPAVHFSEPVYKYYKHDSSVTIVSKSSYNAKWLSIIDAYFLIFDIATRYFPQDFNILNTIRNSSLWSINYSLENMLRARHGVLRSIWVIAPYKILAIRYFGLFQILRYDTHAIYTDIKSRL